MKKFFLPICIFIFVFLVYKFVYPNPRNWYDHYLYLARALMLGRVNLTNLPSFYQDVITIRNNVYVPFPVGPSLMLIPFILANKSVTQQEVSIIVGAADIALFYVLATRFTSKLNGLILSGFLAFGTVLFWTSIVGTTWYYAHVVAFFFLTLSLIAHFSKKDILAGILFSLAVLSRYPIAFGVVFFILQLRNERPRLIKFLVSAIALSPIHFIYSYLRFGNIIQTGYVEVYQLYLKNNYPYTILQYINPKIPLFGYLDLRNIPIHLFTFLIEPPNISQTLQILPSPYGMGIIFTSPLLILALIPPFKKGLETNLIIGALAIAFIDFLHYMQGWVQFGYRFALDFFPFLLVILAVRFKLKRIVIVLILISLVVNFWGVGTAIKLGW